jgi:hypothetical protein
MSKYTLSLMIAVLLMPWAADFILPEGDMDGRQRRRAAEAPEMITTNPDGKGQEIILEFTRGRSHNNPLLAVWLEDMDGNYIQTLYIVQSIGTSVFRHGNLGWGRWEADMVRRPAALPYWGHQRGIKADDGLYLPTPDNPVPDAYTGATPLANFVLKSRADNPLSGKFRVLLELNQAWDWNNYWTNNKFPDDKEYKTSSQPALVYEAVIDMNGNQRTYVMKAIGHSHYSGKDGSLTTDLSTITTALDIAREIVVVIGE